jgi:hypothetical protein
MVWGVLRQPGSPYRDGWELVWAPVWLGLLYEAVDGVFLTVIPVLAASLFVTAAYLWGYAEFGGAKVLAPMMGDAIITLGYLLTGNPITPVVAHVAMHVAAVLHGMETAVQLPPHY